jgi:hypothetical protein
MHRERIAQISLGLIALFMAPAALQATFTPRSFFDDSPSDDTGSPAPATPTTNISPAMSVAFSRL